jgi:NADH dehydrogenase [ubiquinone] 1 alpha subcomplex assembly factor 5
MRMGVFMSVGSTAPFDPVLRRQRHARASGDFHTADFLHERMAGDLRERIDLVSRNFTCVLDLGGPLPIVSGAVRSVLSSGTQEPTGLTVVADEDRLPFAPGSFDLVVSAGGLATVNDLPQALVGIREVLQPDGLFMAAFLGGMSLVELRGCLLESESNIIGGAGSHTAPMVEASAAAGLLARAGFAMPVADVDRVTLRYSSLFGLLSDLTAMGARSVLASRRPLRRDVLAGAAARFAAMADADGKTGVTIEILHVAGWAPAPFQPQPKPRGSGIINLADALKNRV